MEVENCNVTGKRFGTAETLVVRDTVAGKFEFCVVPT
jgi:hypothetical protein